MKQAQWRRLFCLTLSGLAVIFMSGCSGLSWRLSQPKISTQMNGTATADPAPSQSVTPGVAVPGSTIHPTRIPTSRPTSEPSATASPTATIPPVRLAAVVWEENPQIPIINFHRVTPRRNEAETGTLMRLETFQDIIQKLYEAGYSLLGVRDYLDGKIVVPEGRKPLVLSFDDCYFANQLALNEDGTPSELSAVGWLHQFAQENPDFGFDVAMFANFGDKYFGNVFYYDYWYLGDNWQEDFARTIVWGMDHHVMPYNHLFRHPDLELLNDREILPQAEQNDARLRDYLKMAGREDFIGQLSNVIALPYGKWPKYDQGKEILLSYSNQEDKPLEAVFEAGYEYRPMMALSPLDEGYDPYHIPRMSPISHTIWFLLDSAPDLPVAGHCQLELPGMVVAGDSEALGAAIQTAIDTGTCPEGVYVVGQDIFMARGGVVGLWQKPAFSPAISQPAP